MMKQAETSTEKKKVISNLASARALIQADLDQASSVLALWANQVSELEKALEQINLADNSRTALCGTYQGQEGSVPGLAAGTGTGGKARRARKPKEATVVQSEVKVKKRHAAKSASTSAKSKTRLPWTVMPPLIARCMR
jgi:hypothetical protein